MERKTPRESRGVPRPTNPPPWVGVGGAGGLVSATRQICECIRALYPVSRPLAASLLLTHCGGDLMDFFQGCTLFRFNEKDFRDGGLQASTLRRKRKRSGKRPAHQAGQRMQSQACLAPRTVCGCSTDAVCRGGFLGQGDRPLP